MTISTSTIRFLRLALLGGLVTTAPLLAASDNGHDHDNRRSPARLVQIVRENTKQFLDVNNAGPDYVAAFGCVSSPAEGAMGVHYINGELAGDDAVDPTRPEALIYEFSRGRARLVGVEFIVDAEKWDKVHGPGDPPILEGQMFHYVGAPNRFKIPAFYELHVWAWRDNPKGAFVDFNPQVSCEGQ